MRIISWNVNGIRACVNKSFLEWLVKEKPDIVCLQEVKASEGVLPDEVLSPDGYHGYWSFSYKRGYSGVAVLTRIKPLKVLRGIGVREFDREGRFLILQFTDFWLINVYFPNAQHGLKRLSYKLRFNKALEKYVNNLSKPFILTGDFNVAREEIDIARPKSNVGNAGFTDEEREWLNGFLGKGFVDVFRFFHRDKVQYSWWSYRFKARERNIGWRIDYFIVNKGFINKVKDSMILDRVMGSDHCPILLELSL